jgi:hypothetical protein
MPSAWGPGFLCPTLSKGPEPTPLNHDFNKLAAAFSAREIAADLRSHMLGGAGRNFSALNIRHERTTP